MRHGRLDNVEGTYRSLWCDSHATKVFDFAAAGTLRNESPRRCERFPKSKTENKAFFVHRMRLIRGVDEEGLRWWLWACTLYEWPRGCFRRSGKFSWTPRNPRAEFSFHTSIFHSATTRRKWKVKDESGKKREGKHVTHDALEFRYELQVPKINK